MDIRAAPTKKRDGLQGQSSKNMFRTIADIRKASKRYRRLLNWEYQYIFIDVHRARAIYTNVGEYLSGLQKQGTRPNDLVWCRPVMSRLDRLWMRGLRRHYRSRILRCHDHAQAPVFDRVYELIEAVLT